MSKEKMSKNTDTVHIFNPNMTAPRRCPPQVLGDSQVALG
jgi:hypothetical protein